MHEEEAQTQERKQLYNLITEVVATAGDARIGSDETVENTRRAEKLLGELESTRPKSEPLWAMPGSTAGEEEKMGRKGPRGDKFRELQWLLTKLITGRKEF